jgi:hypothetical protein
VSEAARMSVAIRSVGGRGPIAMHVQVPYAYSRTQAAERESRASESDSDSRSEKLELRWLSKKTKGRVSNVLRWIGRRSGHTNPNVVSKLKTLRVA